LLELFRGYDEKHLKIVDSFIEKAGRRALGSDEFMALMVEYVLTYIHHIVANRQLEEEFIAQVRQERIDTYNWLAEVNDVAIVSMLFRFVRLGMNLVSADSPLPMGEFIAWCLQVGVAMVPFIATSVFVTLHY
jgi:hypothetical protein